MLRTRYILILLVFVASAGLTSGQQLYQFSQYLHNPILLNPATTGINNNINLKLSYRNQWTGFNDSPKTYYISLDGTLIRNIKYPSLRSSRSGYIDVRKARKSLNHGVGGYVVSDTYGAFTNTSGYLTYALHVKITGDIRMSLGVAAGLSGWSLNSDKIEVADPNDDTYNYLMAMGLKKSFFDMNGGIWVYADNFYIGYSSEQLLQNQLRDIDIPAEAKVNIHHFTTAGYKFYLNHNLSLTPSVMFKYMRPAPTTLDFNVKIDYKRQLWGGLSYRANDALVIMAGYNIKEKINIGYSYDVTLSEFKKYSTGSHEILVGYKFYKSGRKSSTGLI